MSFGHGSRISTWAEEKQKISKKADRNPVLQSSLEYDKFLQAKLYPVNEPTHGTSRVRKQQPDDSAKDSSGKKPVRPAWASSRGFEEKNGQQQVEGLDPPPPAYGRLVPPSYPILEHSWRRHVAPETIGGLPAKPSSPADFDFGRAPRNAADVAALMAAAQASIDMSRQREKIINGLLYEGSRGEQERLAESAVSTSSASASAHRNRDSSPTRRSVDESLDFTQVSKVRTLLLSRALHNMQDAARKHRLAREQRVIQLSQNSKSALKRRYLRMWRSSARSSAATSSLKVYKLRGVFSKWLSESNRARKNRMLAEEVYSSRATSKAFAALRALVRDRKIANTNCMQEEMQEKFAEGARKQSLLRSAFNGLRIASRADASQRVIEEESAHRRMRIAALVSTLSAPTAASNAEGKGSKTPDDGRGKIHGIKSRRSEAKGRGDAGDAHALSPRNLVLPFGAESKDALRGRSTVVQRGYGAGAKDTRPSWTAEAKPSRPKLPSARGGRSGRSLIDSDDENKGAAPPAYSSVMKPNVADSSLRHPRAEQKPATERENATQQQHHLKSASDAKASQLELDARAEQRRTRLAELRKNAQSRVSSTKAEEEERAKKKQLEEDEQFARAQDDFRHESLAAKAALDEKAHQETELRRKMKMAAQYSARAVLIRAGFGPWQRLMVESRLSWAKAVYHREDTLIQRAWIALYGYCMSSRNERSRREYRQDSTATAHYRRSLTREMWRRWVLGRRMTKAKAKAVTGHFSRYTINRRAFGAWRLALERVRREETQALRAVGPRGKRVFQRYYWLKWLEYHRDALVEREIANRADLTWKKVQGWI